MPEQFDKTKIEITCPSCGSDNVSKSRRPASLAGIFMMLIAIPLPVFQKEYHCYECRLDFKIEKMKH